jgi:N-formylglutamate amidohydrolase
MARRQRVWVIAITAALVAAAWPAAGQERLGPAALVTVQRGAVPVIVSAPHGGRKAVPGVSERQGAGVAKFTKARDENTAELADKLLPELERRLGGKPFAVIARFERKYLDVNRPAGEGYESDAAKPYYDYYHRALADACRAVKARWGRGLLLDLHGQVGRPDAICRGTANLTTVALLRQRFGPAAVTGPKSVLGYLEQHGYAIVPKCDSSDKEDSRYNGGYTVRTYGSHQGYAIDAIQLELGTKYRRKAVLDQTAKDLAEAVHVFAQEYLNDKK